MELECIGLSDEVAVTEMHHLDACDVGPTSVWLELTARCSTDVAPVSAA